MTRIILYLKNFLKVIVAVFWIELLGPVILMSLIILWWLIFSFSPWILASFGIEISSSSIVLPTVALILFILFSILFILGVIGFMRKYKL